MKIFFDTEFLEDGNTIQLISIGMVREDGAEYYAEVKEFDWNQPHDVWLDANVKPHLKGGDSLKSKADIAKDIVSFAGLNPIFYAYFASYDWVALCQLYGRMIDLPHSWPMFPIDLKQQMWMISLKDKPEQDGAEHNAVEDAKWNKKLYDTLDYWYSDANSYLDHESANINIRI